MNSRDKNYKTRPVQKIAANAKPAESACGSEKLISTHCRSKLFCEDEEYS